MDHLRSNIGGANAVEWTPLHEIDKLIERIEHSGRKAKGCRIICSISEIFVRRPMRNAYTACPITES
jgi:hypothetical protein